MNKQTIAAAVAIGGFAALSTGLLLAQRPGGDFVERARQALAEPFVGMTVGGEIETGLFSIEPTGVSTAEVAAAAQAFLASLDDAQRARTLFAVDDTEWRNWANIHRFPRQGVSVDELSPAQLEAGYALLRASLSERGYRTSRDIMRLNHHLAELIDNFNDYGEGLYFFTVMGVPSAEAPWGWQFEGHHLVLNYFVLGDQVVLSPVFMGSEPIRADSGKYAGTSIMDLEQSLALDFLQSLTDGQRADAVLSTDKSRGENQAEMLQDNIDVRYEGLNVSVLDGAQRQGLLDLIGIYVGNMDDGHAAIRMDEVMAHLDRTWFAWKGDFGPDSVFYYRIHSPVIYIEFDHQGPVALAGPRSVATRNHIHSVLRTPNGNDYGKDLLRQHYEAHADDASHGHRTTVTRLRAGL